MCKQREAQATATNGCLGTSRRGFASPSSSSLILPRRPGRVKCNSAPSKYGPPVGLPAHLAALAEEAHARAHQAGVCAQDARRAGDVASFEMWRKIQARHLAVFWAATRLPCRG